MKILIAGTPHAITQALAAHLAPEHEIHMCHDSRDITRSLQELRPDILVLSLQLRYTDGLSILQRTGHTPPVTIALTTVASVSVFTAASNLGVTKIFMLPCSTKAIAGYINETVPSLV